MMSSLFAGIVAAIRYPLSAICRRQATESEKRTPPRLEVLENRCLLSAATTTVPALTDIPPLIAIADVVFATQVYKGNPTVVFVGDSISWEYAYGTGAVVWANFMAPLGMADYGVPGQTTQSLLFQLSLGQLAGIHPSMVVLDIGGNNLLQGDTPQDTAAGVLADVIAIHQYLPQAQVVVLGVLPGKESPNDPYRLAGAQTNQLVSQMLAGDPKAEFVNIGNVFLEPDGTISNTIMFDYLHPTALGYWEMTGVLLPVLYPTVSANPPAAPATPATPGLTVLVS
jgi:lysophospholipase L1-like esterase